MQAENMVSLIKVDFVKEYVDSSTCTNCCYVSCLSRCFEFNNKIHEMDVKKKKKEKGNETSTTSAFLFHPL